MIISTRQQTLLEQRALLRTAIAEFDAASNGDSNDVEHDTATTMREEALGLLSTTLLFIDPQALLVLMRNAAADMLSLDRHTHTQAADRLRGLFLDMDALHSAGGPLAAEWKYASADPEDLCRAGDADPTRENLTQTCGELCPNGSFTCTRRAGHIGRQHVAGDGTGYVAGTWPWRSAGGTS